MSKLKKILICIGILLIIVLYNINIEPDPEEVVTFFVKNNNKLLEIRLKRCFLDDSDPQKNDIEDGTVWDSAWLSFPLYFFSQNNVAKMIEQLETCPEHDGIPPDYVTIGPIVNARNFDDSQLQNPKKIGDSVIDIGYDNIDAVYFPIFDRKRARVFVHRPLDDGEYPSPFQNLYSITTPINNYFSIEYTIFTRYYATGIKHRIPFSKEQCVKQQLQCGKGNAADSIYDAVQRGENMLECKACKEAFLQQNESIIEFFNSFCRLVDQGVS